MLIHCIILGLVRGALQPDLPCHATTALDPKSKEVPLQFHSLMPELFREDAVYWLQANWSQPWLYITCNNSKDLAVWTETWAMVSSASSHHGPMAKYTAQVKVLQVSTALSLHTCLCLLHVALCWFRATGHKGTHCSCPSLKHHFSCSITMFW